MALLRMQYSETEVCGRYRTYPKKETDKEGGAENKRDI